MRDGHTAFRRWATGGVCAPLLAAALLTGCSSGSYDSSRLTVVGDSLTYLDQPELSQALKLRYTIAYVFRFGISIAAATDLLRAELAADGRPGALIENLGTNDALSGRTGSGPQPTLEPVVLAASGIPCVILTTVNTHADERGGSNVADRINGEITWLHLLHPKRYRVVDWNRFLQSLSPADAARYLQADRIHETHAGALWLAGAYESAINSCHLRAGG
jgi:hypothetical protein